MTRQDVADFATVAILACLCGVVIVMATRAHPLLGIAAFWGIAGLAMDCIENEGSEHL